eukprot:TRINITY_DN11007_c0_g1_i1.p1 TRINITY_DN11007_c0_g1~~TRINITY_DN11007_c0_g1_i1.p1  ORF type:complete len:649 (-),score=147.37 TRINITY_DN11007_c0_g1_i1:64-2010(-)
MAKSFNWHFTRISVYFLFIVFIFALFGGRNLYRSYNSSDINEKSKQVKDNLMVVQTNSNEASEICEKVGDQHDPCGAISEYECSTGGLLNYLGFYYCTMKNVKWLAMILFIIYLVLLFYFLGVSAEDFFCPTLAVISEILRLSPDVAGITILALGNGAPDVFSTFVGVTTLKFDIAIGALTGAGVFVTTVVVGAVTLSAQCNLERVPFIRDVVFYVCTVTVVFIICLTKEIYLWESLVFLVLYSGYVAFSVILNVIKNKKAAEEQKKTSVVYESDNDDSYGSFKRMSLGPNVVRSKSIDEHRKNLLFSLGMYTKSVSDDEIQYDTEELSLNKSINYIKEKEENKEICFGFNKKQKWIDQCVGSGGNLINSFEWDEKGVIGKILFVVLFPISFILGITIPQCDEENYIKIYNVLSPTFSPLVVMVAFGLYDVYIFGVIPLFIIVEIVGMGFSVLVFFTSDSNSLPKYNWVNVIISFFMSVLWIYLIANELVSLLQTIGTILDIPQAIMGMTVLAWGNSISDMVADVVVAKQGFPSMAIAACFGGPLFNMLVGLGISTVFVNIQHFPNAYNDVILNSNLITSFSTLIITLIFSLIVVILTKFILKKEYAYCLFIIYLLFTVINLLIQFNVIPNCANVSFQDGFDNCKNIY